MLVESFLERNADRLSEKTALIVGPDHYTYGYIERNANRLSRGLLDLGKLKRGDRVAIFLDSGKEAVLAVFATLKAGGVFVVLDPTSKSPHLEHILDNTRASILITDTKRHVLFSKAIECSEQLRTVIITDGPQVMPSPPPGRAPGFPMESILKRYQDDDTPPPKHHLSIDLAALIYTSGSTGAPKGVMLTHANMVAAATSIITSLDNLESDIILSVLPLSFDYGLYQVLMTTQFGGTLVLEPSFAFHHAVLQKLVEERVTGFPLVPTISAILLDIDLSKYDLSSLRYLTSTAAALPLAHIEQLRRRLPHVTVYSMYGLTECKRVAYLPPKELDRRPGSVGIAIPDTEVWVVDENGQPVGPGVVGELVVRGPHVMLGYWEDPEATAERLKPGKLRREEVLSTGDLFETDDDGFLYFVGRTDDIFKSRGEKVAPKAIEESLCALDGVKAAAVLGLSDAILGNRIVAFVSLSTGSTLTREQIFRHCRNNLQYFMVPQEIELEEDLPVDQRGKVDKAALREAKGWRE